MALIVKAPLVIARSEAGGDLYLYQGAPVPDGQSPEWIDSHLDSDMVEEVKDAPAAKAAEAPRAAKAPG